MVGNAVKMLVAWQQYASYVADWSNEAARRGL
jgi:hypothetical protein